MARIGQLDNRLMKIEEQCQPTPSLDHAASRLVKKKNANAWRSKMGRLQF